MNQSYWKISGNTLFCMFSEKNNFICNWQHATYDVHRAQVSFCIIAKLPKTDKIPKHSWLRLCTYINSLNFHGVSLKNNSQCCFRRLCFSNNTHHSGPKLSVWVSAIFLESLKKFKIIQLARHTNINWHETWKSTVHSENKGPFTQHNF